MAGQNGSAFPFTAVAVVVAFMSSVVLVQKPFVFPDRVIEHFAATMGPTLKPAWSTRIGLPGTTSSRQTLLDDWIDIQILARRTADIGPLIILPAVVLALIVVAHSRPFDNREISQSSPSRWKD